MNTLLDKQYCHCCPNKSLNKKSKSLLLKMKVLGVHKKGSFSPYPFFVNTLQKMTTVTGMPPHHPLTPQHL